MPIKYCPYCQQQIIMNDYDLDYDHTCNPRIAGSAVGQEDRADITKSKQVIGNALWGTRAGHEGYKKPNLTLRGNKVDTHTTSDREVFIKKDETD